MSLQRISFGFKVASYIWTNLYSQGARSRYRRFLVVAFVYEANSSVLRHARSLESVYRFEFVGNHTCISCSQIFLLPGLKLPAPGESAKSSSVVGLRARRCGGSNSNASFSVSTNVPFFGVIPINTAVDPLTHHYTLS